MRIIVDAMGGDNAPLAIVKGALRGQKRWGVDITLTGDEAAIRQALTQCGVTALPQGMDIVPTTEEVTMEDDPSTVFRRKKDTSMGVGLTLLREGQGDAFISAGNSGALLTAATLLVKRIRGIRRAAFAPLLPTEKDGAILIDAGANIECTPEFLMQFGCMGALYAQKALGIPQPRVALLNNGAEDTKGDELHKGAYALLDKAGQTGLIRFAGNIEARDVLTGAADVIVADGFSGNVLLKSTEGTAIFMSRMIKDMFRRSLLSKIGYLCCKKGLQKIRKTMDYRETGGSVLVGLNKPVIKAHGSSDALAIRGAMRQAITAVKSGFCEEIRANISKMTLPREVPHAE